jgi:glycosyltransferase involved in cell wall biosynthesis
MTNPVLSVTVTNYNYAPYLRQCVESILSQTYENFELIIIDNASTDGSADLIHDLASEDRRIRQIVHPQNEGMLFSYREAAAESRGIYRVHVEADDWVIDPKAFEVQIAILDENTTMSFCHSAITMVERDGQVIYVAESHDGDTIQPGERALERLLMLGLTHTGMMIRQDAYRATPGYEEGFPHTTDTMLAVHLCAVGEVGYVERSLYAFRQHGSNLHLRDEAGLVENEYFPMIAAAFAGPLPSKMDDPGAARRRVEQNALIHLPRQYIFSGDPRRGWRLYWQSTKVRPYRTVAQRETAYLLARTALGQHRYEWFRTRFDNRWGAKT